MRADRRWVFVALLIVVCSARTGAWQTLCDRACLLRITDAMAASHLIRVRDRTMHEIEASGAVLPSDSRNGWSDFTR